MGAHLRARSVELGATPFVNRRPLQSKQYRQDHHMHGKQTIKHQVDSSGRSKAQLKLLKETKYRRESPLEVSLVFTNDYDRHERF